MRLKAILEPNNIADDVYNVVVNNCEFFLDNNNEAFLVYTTRKNYKLVYLSYADRAKQFFTDLYFRYYNATVRKGDVLTAYDTICAVVRDCIQKTPVYTRVGHHNGTLYYDLSNKSGEVIEINTKGVFKNKKSAINNVFFYEDDTMCEQVSPIQTDYSLLDFISEFFNVEECHRLLLAVYLCAAFIPNICHPILIVEGEKGSGKTTANKRLSKIFHPVTKDVLVLPKKEDNLITALSNNYFSAFDNIGNLSPDFCNIFCQASTGGTLIKRKLYSDNTEICINIKRLVALNGINLQISQADILDRAIMIHLNRIDESKRCPEEILNTKFQSILPEVLGDIFNILSKALAIYPTINLSEYPRMADFSRYGYAIAEAIEVGYGAKFIEAYKQNIKLATESAVQENPVLNSVRELVKNKKYWKGTMTELLNELQKIVRNLYIGKSLPTSFPNNANSLSRMLNTHKHELKNLDIQIEIGRNTNRYVKLNKIGAKLSPISTTKNDLKITENRKDLLNDYD